MRPEGAPQEAEADGAVAAAGQVLMLWVGPPSGPALTCLQLCHSSARWAAFDPAYGSRIEGLSPEVGRLLKRRYYLVEKAKQAQIVGLLVGTLGSAGYLQTLHHIRSLAAAAGKKTYTLLMGKPQPAKLANFPEVGK